MARFDGRTVIVTGSARNLGAAQARAFAQEGANIIVADIADEGGRDVAAELGDAARFIHLDVVDEGSWKSCVTEVEAAFGPVNVLVNNAAVIPMAPLEDMPLGDIRQALEVNLLGPILGTRAVAPSMRRAGGGAIVNISSSAGLVGVTNFAAYSATKWGLRGLAKSTAMELAKDGIRVNTVHPGVIGNPETVHPGVISEEWAALAELVAQRVAKCPISRPGRPEEIAEMVLFAASDAASFTTGQEFIADGGQTIGVHA